MLATPGALCRFQQLRCVATGTASSGERPVHRYRVMGVWHAPAEGDAGTARRLERIARSGRGLTPFRAFGPTAISRSNSERGEIRLPSVARSSLALGGRQHAVWIDLLLEPAEEGASCGGCYFSAVVGCVKSVGADTPDEGSPLGIKHRHGPTSFRLGHVAAEKVLGPEVRRSLDLRRFRIS